MYDRSPVRGVVRQPPEAEAPVAATPRGGPAAGASAPPPFSPSAPFGLPLTGAAALPAMRMARYQCI